MITAALAVAVAGGIVWVADGIRWAINEPTAFKAGAE